MKPLSYLGCLILIVGPSGVGKDTLIDAARRRFSTDPRFLFPRRVVSRPPGKGEDNDFLDASTIDWLAEDGAFALHWHAHGMSYAIPRTIENALFDGACVVCNVSRAVIEQARHTYPCRVIEITASQEVLAARLKSRRRESDGDLALRLQRATVMEVAADARLVNDDNIEIGISRFCRILHDIAEERRPLTVGQDAI